MEVTRWNIKTIVKDLGRYHEIRWNVIFHCRLMDKKTCDLGDLAHGRLAALFLGVLKLSHRPLPAFPSPVWKLPVDRRKHISRKAVSLKSRRYIRNKERILGKHL